MARRWALVKGIMDRMDWDKEVEMEVEVEVEVVDVAILCNAIYTILLDLYSPTTHISTRLLLVFGACKDEEVQVPMGITYIIHRIIHVSPRVARGCSAAKCVILAIASSRKPEIAMRRATW